MQKLKKIAAILVVAAALVVISSSCRASKRQGCPTFKFHNLQILESQLPNG